MTVLSITLYLLTYLFGFVLLLFCMLVLQESSKIEPISPKEIQILFALWCVALMLAIIGPYWMYTGDHKQLSEGILIFAAGILGFCQSAALSPWIGPTMIDWYLQSRTRPEP